MFTLILLVILGLVFGYFATQNTLHIPITIASYTLRDVPLYAVLGITLLVGFGISWIISLLDSISVALKLRGKESTIKNTKTTVNVLEKRVNELELENAKLKGQLER